MERCGWCDQSLDERESVTVAGNFYDREHMKPVRVCKPCAFEALAGGREDFHAD